MNNTRASSDAQSVAALLNLGIIIRPDGPTEQRVPCPRCDKGPRDDALGVNIATGVFGCFRCGWRGRAGGSIDGSNIIRTSPAAAVVPCRTSGLAPWAQRLWDESQPLDGAAVEYLKCRHCVVPPADGDLRFHHALRHPCGHVGPALVARVTHAITGAPMSLHRTWITTTGKARIEKPRLLLKDHQKRGGVIRLWPDEAVTYGLAVAEGIETALAAAHGFTPTWACTDAGNMAALPVLSGVESLMIFADHDPAGRDAAQALAQRWANAGREVRIAMSEREGFDIADEVAA
ncbi:MAG: DUF7146 domain-containing protein [Steroidobacteraceae bacterium]